MADFDAVANAIAGRGGLVALPKFAVPGVCWQGYFVDPQGNTFGVFQAGSGRALAVDHPGGARALFLFRPFAGFRDNEMTGKYPYTIDNGQGELLTFTGVTRGPDGERVEVDGAAQPGAGPPMHVHYLQDEAAQVITGRSGYQVFGGKEQFAGPGESVVWPAGTGHKWWNAGDTELRLIGWCKPPGNVEFYLGAVFASTKEHGGRPSLYDAAFLARRYRSEFAMLGAPDVSYGGSWMPVLYVVGRVLGKYRKYKDAPAPL